MTALGELGASAVLAVSEALEHALGKALVRSELMV